MAKAFKAKGSIDNIRAMLLMATPQQIADGIGWYDSFKEDIIVAAQREGMLVRRADHNRLIGIAAAFSPRRNPRDTVLVFARFVRVEILGGSNPCPGKGYSFPGQDNKARRIAAGADPAIVLRGVKEVAFYANISGNTDIITIDTHAWNLWVGRYVTRDEDIKVPTSGPQRDACIEDYRAVGREFSLPPSKVQAIGWLVWRDLHQTDKTKRQRGAGDGWVRIA